MKTDVEDRTSWWPLVAIVAGVFVLMLDATVVTVALPALSRDLGTDLSGLQWVLNAYTLAMAAVQLTTGALADRWGHRRIFLVGLVAFGLASAACAAANRTEALIAARVVQGVAGALLFAATLALIARCYQGSARGIAFGVRGSAAGTAVVAGPVVGGALVSTVGWRWIFLVNVPVVAIALVLAARTLPRDHDRDDERVTDHRLDLPGAVLLAAGLLALITALLRGNTDGWTSGRTAVLVGIAVVGLAGFLVREAFTRHPMLDLGSFRRASFTGTQLGSFTVQAAVFSLLAYLSLYFQGELGYSAVHTGLSFLPLVAPILLAGPLAGALLDRLPSRLPVAGGLALAGAGLLVMHRLSPGSGWTPLLPGMVLVGFACGIALPALGSLAVDVPDARRVGMASGVNNTVLQVGATLGIAINGAILGSQPGTRAGFVAALNTMLLVGAALASVSAILTWFLLRAPRPPAAATRSLRRR